jgi:EpsI family protein
MQLAPSLAVDASALATLPLEIAGHRAHEIPLEQAVEAELRADYNVQRAYLHPSGEVVWLYVGYYGTTRGGRPEHTPRGCYTGAGYGIVASRALLADAAAGLRVNEYLVERDGERQLVQFWFRSHRRTGMLGGLDQNLDRLLGRLLEGRADGALLRVSTPLREGDDVAARGRLLAFAAALDPLVAARWPTESPAR